MTLLQILDRFLAGKRTFKESMKDSLRETSSIAVKKMVKLNLVDVMPIQGATLDMKHRRPYDLNEKTGLYEFRTKDDQSERLTLKSTYQIIQEIADDIRYGILDEQTAHNLVLNAGRVQCHKQVYGSSGLSTNGFNYLAVTNDSASPAAGDTTLASEITTNGLARVQGAVTLPTGSGNTTSITTTWTASGTQSAQKFAQFDASSAGNMNHEILFTQRTLVVNDQLIPTVTDTLG